MDAREDGARGTDATHDGSGDDPVAATGVDPAMHAQELLAEHVPLALIADLLTPTGDTSAEILEAEGLPEESWWEPVEGDDASHA